MKLMTKELEKRFARIGRQEGVKDPIIVAKYFYPRGAGTWYATEYYPEWREFFGYVSISGDHCDEWGYFSLTELESFSDDWGVRIERDLYFTEQPASQAIGEDKLL